MGFNVLYMFIFRIQLQLIFSAIPEDAVREDSEDEDKVNADERLPQSVQDKRIAPDNEFSDSEDEGSGAGGGRRDNRSFKGRKRPRLDQTKPDTDVKMEDIKPDSKGNIVFLMKWSAFS